MLCLNCNEYYNVVGQAVTCPHGWYTIDGPKYGWVLTAEDKNKLQEAYQSNNKDFIRTYLGHANPVLRGFAASLFDALSLKEKLASEVQVYEPDHNAESNWTDTSLNNVQYFESLKS